MITCIPELCGGSQAKKSERRGKWDGQRVRSDAIGTKSSVRHVCVWCMIGRSPEGLLERR